MRLLRRGLQVVLGLLLLAGATFLYLNYAPIGDSATHPFNQDRNGVWYDQPGRVQFTVLP